MVHNNKEVLAYWNKQKVESMYDKNLIRLEINLIKNRIKSNCKILDAGCGEAEGTLEYAKIENTIIHAADFSETRLKKAKSNLKNIKNVQLFHVDFLSDYQLDNDYDYIISQRLLINLMEWDLQQKVLIDLKKLLKPGGRIILMEGSQNGVDQLNKFRDCYRLSPLPIKWHNLFFRDEELIGFMEDIGFKNTRIEGLGSYFLLTRGLRPYFHKELDWDNEFNKLSSSDEILNIFNLMDKFSRIKLFEFQKV